MNDENTYTDANIEEKKSSSDVVGTVVTIIMITLVFAFFVAVIGVAIWGIKSLFSSYADVRSHNAVIEEISAGTISDKEIINGETVNGGGFIYSNGKPGYYLGGDKEYIPTRYRLHITFEYEYKDEKYQGTKYFDVSEEVYLAYRIGDYFDSKDFEKTEITSSVSP